MYNGEGGFGGEMIEIISAILIYLGIVQLVLIFLGGILLWSRVFLYGVDKVAAKLRELNSDK
jgi:hypothetical protein